MNAEDGEVLVRSDFETRGDHSVDYRHTDLGFLRKDSFVSVPEIPVSPIPLRAVAPQHPPD